MLKMNIISVSALLYEIMMQMNFPNKLLLVMQAVTKTNTEGVAGYKRCKSNLYKCRFRSATTGECNITFQIHYSKNWPALRDEAMHYY